MKQRPKIDHSYLNSAKGSKFNSNPKFKSNSTTESIRNTAKTDTNHQAAITKFRSLEEIPDCLPDHFDWGAENYDCTDHGINAVGSSVKPTFSNFDDECNKQEVSAATTTRPRSEGSDDSEYESEAFSSYLVGGVNASRNRPAYSPEKIQLHRNQHTGLKISIDDGAIAPPLPYEIGQQRKPLMRDSSEEASLYYSKQPRAVQFR